MVVIASVEDEPYLEHYGILRRSGRYPWGSGGNQSTRNRTFLQIIDGLRKKGMTDTQIAQGFGITTTQMRAAMSIAKNEQKAADISYATRLRAKGMSTSAIARKMGKNESSVRALLEPSVKDRINVLERTVMMLKEQVAKKLFLDVGVGNERFLGISQTKLGTALARLEEEGYVVHRVKLPQVGTGKQTEYKVLAAPGTTQKQVWQHRHEIQSIEDHSDDGGRSFLGTKPPLSISSRRVLVRYADEGGAMEDGVIYLRPGVKDLSLGSKRYAQVRIAVDGTHYMKGMAMYRDDLPPGVDVIYNSNKRSTGNKKDAMKPLKVDAEGKMSDLPFGSIVRQRTDPKTGKVVSAINVVGSKEGAGEEGSWDTWSRALSSQFLSKQSPVLARTQLAVVREKKQQQLDEIMALTNPSIRQKLLESFADDADSASVHLKAAKLPRQANRVILPIKSLKDNEVYAPGFKPGEKVVLIRHPHGGIFEIPELTVNNRNPDGKKMLGDAEDAIGINHNVAARLSGADFDGDTVIVIPNNQGRVKTAPALAALKGFDPVALYPAYPGMPKMDSRTKGIEMGKISNLITDMTIKRASPDEIARAVKHSMVVIDAEKHNLNYKQSAKDNGIAQLKEKYQGSKIAGASTLISRAGSDHKIDDRKPRSAAKGGPVDKKTGEKMFEPTGRTTINRKGEVIPKKLTVERLSVEKDAFKLSSGTKIEQIYAEHSNALKAMANTARKEAVNTKLGKYSPSAKKAYAQEVADLNHKLNIALLNAPRERRAQVIANQVVSQKRHENPHLEDAELKKIKTSALIEARARTRASKTRINITDREWEAIQAGAITPSKLSAILNNTDLDQIKQRATPKITVAMTAAKLSRARQMKALGYTMDEIADHLGVAKSTIQSALKG